MTTRFDRRRLIKGSALVPRRDDIVVQALEGGGMKGYGIDDETPDRKDSEAAVAVIADLYSRFGAAAHG